MKVPMADHSQDNMLAGYDQMMLDPMQALYYGFSDFHNFGFWSAETKSQSEASENLLEKLLSFVPAKHGKILDVACGLGASTRHLMKYYEPSDIYAINISNVQIERAQKNAPGCHVLNMDATKLEFPDGFFDAVICVEAAFHFDTRQRFFQEALRVLKPGGWLTQSDILSQRMPPEEAQRLHLPADNYLDSPADLAAAIQSAGFENVTVIDATDECWGGFCRGLEQWASRASSRPAAGEQAQDPPALFNPVSFAAYIRAYLLAAGQKPAVV
jgi:MPBQ/MSBQ methyltransferase